MKTMMVGGVKGVRNNGVKNAVANNTRYKRVLVMKQAGSDSNMSAVKCVKKNYRAGCKSI